MGITCVLRAFFFSCFYIYNNYVLHITNYNSNAIAHVHRVTYRGEVPSAHRELVQSTAATSRLTTPSSNPEVSTSERFPRPAGEGKDKSSGEQSLGAIGLVDEGSAE